MTYDISLSGCYVIASIFCRSLEFSQIFPIEKHVRTNREILYHMGTDPLCGQHQPSYVRPLFHEVPLEKKNLPRHPEDSVRRSTNRRYIH